jgi:hypothetical protein
MNIAGVISEDKTPIRTKKGVGSPKGVWNGWWFGLGNEAYPTKR